MRTINTLLNTVNVTAEVATKGVIKGANVISNTVDVVDKTATSINNLTDMLVNWSEDLKQNQIQSRATRQKTDKVNRAIEEVKLDDALEELFKLQDQRSNRMSDFEARKAKFFAE